MVTVNLEEYIVPLNELINKETNKISMKEIISLIFHAAILMSNDITDTDKDKWEDMLNEFKMELEKQNKDKWPKMTIIKNDYSKRIDVIITNKSFIKSQNIFTLLLRLLFVENYKCLRVHETHDFHKILEHKLKMDNAIKDMTVDELFNYLKNHIIYYMGIYNNNLHLEYQLAKSILKQLD